MIATSKITNPCFGASPSILVPVRLRTRAPIDALPPLPTITILTL